MMWRSVLVLAICAWIALACGGGGSGGSNTATAAIDAMGGLDSYEVSMDFGEEASLLKPTVVRFQSPDRYHVRVSEREADAHSEFIRIGDEGWKAVCDNDGQCDEWEETELPEAPVFGPSPFFMLDWPLVALELAKGIARDNAVLRARVNPMRAVFENQRRVFEELGLRSYGTECSSAVTPIEITPVPLGEDAPTPVDSGEVSETCRDLTYQDLLENEADDLAFFDEHPATIEATISADDSLVRRVVITIPSRGDDEEGETQIAFEYSRYNDITIEAPLP
jgi:hypothetical protein